MAQTSDRFWGIGVFNALERWNGSVAVQIPIVMTVFIVFTAGELAFKMLVNLKINIQKTKSLANQRSGDQTVAYEITGTIPRPPNTPQVARSGLQATIDTSSLCRNFNEEPETVVGNPHIFLAPEAKADIPSPSNPARPVSPPGNVRPSVKRKPKIESGEQASRTSISPPLGRCEYINIGAHQDKLNLSVVEKLPSAVALAATSVHKYWTSSFGKAADTAEVTELMKLAEMYTSRSHVLNYELYKMLEMKVDEIHPVLGEDEDADAMRVGVKRLRARLAFSEDARTRTMYDVTKAQTIQKACIVAQKKAESQLKSCQSMIQAKDRELTEILNELAKAKGLLAKLGVSGYTVT
ncbi:hypothetical protein Fot_07417 [Forsythia ovata]|uniref:Uncharacterized protein n=1 Tax=Forsythia ovata TaxID=205694 RepID=A0ABD1WVR5_9LAMI